MINFMGNQYVIMNVSFGTKALLKGKISLGRIILNLLASNLEINLYGLLQRLTGI